MKAVIAEFAFQAQGPNRDELISIADALAIDVLDNIGGHPWVMVDDDFTKNQANGSGLADDQGFVYIGKRRYVFTGPVREHPNMKPGEELQKAVADAQD